MGFRLLLSLLFVGAIAGTIFLGHGQQPAQPQHHGRQKANPFDESFTKEIAPYLRFYPQKDGINCIGDRYRITIWTDKRVYKIGEPVKLYIEFLKTQDGTEECEFDKRFVIIVDPYHDVGSSSDSKLIIYKVDERKFVWQKFLYGYSVPRPAEKYIVKPEEIDNPVVRQRMRVAKDWWEEDLVLNPGESVVVRIDDITKFFPEVFDPTQYPKVTEKVPFYMYLARLEGVYRIQYISRPGIGPAPIGNSNIIEFEIRR